MDAECPRQWRRIAAATLHGSAPSICSTEVKRNERRLGHRSCVQVAFGAQQLPYPPRSSGCSRVSFEGRWFMFAAHPARHGSGSSRLLQAVCQPGIAGTALPAKSWARCARPPAAPLPCGPAVPAAPTRTSMARTHVVCVGQPGGWLWPIPAITQAWRYRRAMPATLTAKCSTSPAPGRSSRKTLRSGRIARALTPAGGASPTGGSRRHRCAPHK